MFGAIRMWKNKGIAFKLILFFTASSTLIFSIVFGYNYWFSRKIIEKDMEEKARNLVLATVNRIEAVLRPVQKVPENLAYFMEYGSCDKEELLRLLREVVENNSEIYGSAFAFEPYAFEKKSLYFGPYFYKKRKEIAFTYLGGNRYPYFSWDWYQIPKELGRPDWSEPYYDEGGGNILMATYSVPFYRKVGGAETIQRGRHGRSLSRDASRRRLLHQGAPDGIRVPDLEEWNPGHPSRQRADHE